MKKLLCILLSMILTLTPITVFAQNNNEFKSSNDVTITDVYEGSYSTNSILNIYASELDENNYSFSSLKKFINKGGIIVVDNDVVASTSLCKELNMQIEPEYISSME